VRAGFQEAEDVRKLGTRIPAAINGLKGARCAPARAPPRRDRRPHRCCRVRLRADVARRADDLVEHGVTGGKRVDRIVVCTGKNALRHRRPAGGTTVQRRIASAVLRGVPQIKTARS